MKEGREKGVFGAGRKVGCVSSIFQVEMKGSNPLMFPVINERRANLRKKMHPSFFVALYMCLVNIKKQSETKINHCGYLDGSWSL